MVNREGGRERGGSGAEPWALGMCRMGMKSRGPRRWSEQLQEILPRKRVTLRRGARLACSTGEWVPMARGGRGDARGSGARAHDNT